MKSFTQESESGFSLLEVVVGFTVLAITLTIAIQTLSGGIAAIKRGTTADKVTFAVRELIATEVKSVSGSLTRNGQLENGLSWSMVSRAIGEKGTPTIYQITITLSESARSGSTQTFEYFALGSNDAN